MKCPSWQIFLISLPISKMCADSVPLCGPMCPSPRWSRPSSASTLSKPILGKPRYLVQFVPRASAFACRSMCFWSMWWLQTAWHDLTVAEKALQERPKKYLIQEAAVLQSLERYVRHHQLWLEQSKIKVVLTIGLDSSEMDTDELSSKCRWGTSSS